MSRDTNADFEPSLEKTYKIGAFKGWVLENFPFIEADFDALTNYQLWCKVVEYLNKVIENINATTENVTNLATAFEQLQNYINNYFDNLDVQDEINNKLDNLVEAGFFDNFVSNFLKLIRIYDTTVEMLSDVSNLVLNEKIRTLGYYNINDGGGALFLITNVNDPQSYNIRISDNLYARLISDTINPIQLGAHGNGVDDDYEALNRAVNLALTRKKILVSPPNKTYLTSQTLYVNELYMDFNYSTITTNSNINILSVYTNNLNGHIRRLTLDCANANAGIYCNNARRKMFSEINFINIKKYGFYHESGFEVYLKDSYFIGNGENQSIGIFANTSDSKYENLIMVDCFTAIVNRGLNYFESIHAWINTSAIVPNSTFFECRGNTAFISQCFSDTYYITCKLTGGIAIIDKMTVLFNQAIYLPSQPAPYFFFIDNWYDLVKRSSVVNSSITGAYNTKPIIFSNYSGTNKVSNNNLVWVNDYVSGLIYQPVASGNGMNLLESHCIVDNSTMYLNIVFTLDTNVTSYFSFQNLPTEFKPYGNIESTCSVSSTRYDLATAKGQLFIGDHIQGKIPDNNEVNYVYIQTSYHLYKNENY